MRLGSVDCGYRIYPNHNPTLHIALSAGALEYTNYISAVR